MRVQVTINLDEEGRTAFAAHFGCSRDSKVLMPKVRAWMLKKCNDGVPGIMQKYLEGRLEDLQKGKVQLTTAKPSEAAEKKPRQRQQ
jgi:hypothetical protein